MSQEELATRGGVHRNAQGKYERDLTPPDVAYLQRVAEVGVDVLYVITGRHTPPAAEGQVLTAEEASLVEHYRRAAAEGRQAATTVLAGLAALAQQKKT